MESHGPAEAATEPGPDSNWVSLLAFWADAGVDTAFEEAAVNRLAPAPPPPEPRPAPPPSLPSPAIQVPGTSPSAVQITFPAEQIERARALARSAEDWPSLQAAIERFDGPLRPRSAPTVIARGAATPLLLVIGEGPSVEDEAAGAPFSGRIGGMLDRMLAAAGVGDQSLILPTAFWRGKDRAAIAALEAISAPFLERAVELTRPRALLLLGEAAVRSGLRRQAPILQTRGRWADWTSLADERAESVPALPIFHPAFLLQHPGAKKRTWGDLLLLVEKLKRP